MHDVMRLWVRPVMGGPVIPRDELVLEEGAAGGVVGDHQHGSERHVTIVFADDWAEACDELGQPVDPAGRRANVLVSGGGGRLLVGSRLALGEATIEIRGLVAPCAQMDVAAPGLMRALQPRGRAGIWGRVVRSGTVRIGDAATEPLG